MPFRNGKFQGPLISNGVNPLERALLSLKFIFPKEEDVNCKNKYPNQSSEKLLYALRRFLDTSRNLLTIS